ncbi:MAG: D-alanyl-D-alanine carboxypeptidase/D-alanyl-D-alanine-endopeptidase, partial [bacterium]|nr:D-alanyl-D-alanine carboxypeptidase/D-alanyl-D-alanine-endopeptidase [bacterium]
SVLSFGVANAIRYSHKLPPKPAEPIVLDTAAANESAIEEDILLQKGSQDDDEPEATPLDSLSREKTLQARVDEWLRKPYINKALWGIRVEQLGSRKIVYDRSGDKPLIPASNMKLFTACAAFEKLGGEFRFRTAFVASKPLDNKGVLNGNLQIIGSGDPTLSRIFHDEALSQLLGGWADSLIARGLKKITGRVEVPEIFWAEGGPAPGWEWNDLAESYAAFPDIVAMNDNCFDLLVDAADQIGDTARYLIDPEVLQGADDFSFEAITTPPKTKASLEIIPSFWTGQWRVIGSIPIAARQSRRRVTIRNPREVWRRTMESVLKAKGVQIGVVQKKGRKSAGLDFGMDAEAAEVSSTLFPDTLWVAESLPVKRIVKEVLKRSHNLSAEHLFRTVGYYDSEVWSNESGRSAVTNLMRQWGLDTKTFTISDGSGLGRASNIPPEVFTQLLDIATTKPWFNEFYEELPEAGEPQTTMQKRKLKLPDNVSIKAKTGTLNKVSTLSGYITSPSDTLTFSILCNHWYGNVRRVKEVQNGILTELAWSLSEQGPRIKLDPSVPDRFPIKK